MEYVGMLVVVMWYVWIRLEVEPRESFSRE